ncbi:MAG: hypothetical protein ACNA7H_13585, partial [Desulfotignum sp.]
MDQTKHADKRESTQKNQTDPGMPIDIAVREKQNGRHQHIKKNTGRRSFLQISDYSFAQVLSFKRHFSVIIEGVHGL